MIITTTGHCHLIMDIIGAMDAQNWITLIHMFRKRSKATKQRPSLARCSVVKPIDTFYSFCRTSGVEI